LSAKELIQVRGRFATAAPSDFLLQSKGNKACQTIILLGSLHTVIGFAGNQTQTNTSRGDSLDSLRISRWYRIGIVQTMEDIVNIVPLPIVLTCHSDMNDASERDVLLDSKDCPEAPGKELPQN
jgi:hypothetical protein